MKGERCAFLVGIGMGVPENMTGEALAAFRQADCILGSGRMLDSFRDWGVLLFDAYDPGKMLDFVKGHPAYRKIAVALSGMWASTAGRSGFWRPLRRKGSGQS